MALSSGKEMSIGQGGACHTADPLAHWCVSCSHNASCMGSALCGHLRGQASGASVSSAVASPEVSTQKSVSSVHCSAHCSSVSLAKVSHLPTPDFKEGRDMPS